MFGMDPPHPILFLRTVNTGTLRTLLRLDLCYSRKHCSYPGGYPIITAHSEALLAPYHLAVLLSLEVWRLLWFSILQSPLIVLALSSLHLCNIPSVPLACSGILVRLATSISEIRLIASQSNHDRRVLSPLSRFIVIMHLYSSNECYITKLLVVL